MAPPRSSLFMAVACGWSQTLAAPLFLVPLSYTPLLAEEADGVPTAKTPLRRTRFGDSMVDDGKRTFESTENVQASRGLLPSMRPSPFFIFRRQNA